MSKISNYCEIDIKSKESYSGMQTNASLSIKSKYSDDITSLVEPSMCEDKINNTVLFSAASNYKPRWEMILETKK
jgi:hypothetical protein